MSTKQIENHHADYIIHTDVSATLGSKDGGFAVVITQGPANNPARIDTIKERGRAFTFFWRRISSIINSFTLDKGL